jgi:GTPase SAR1 family protein
MKVVLISGKQGSGKTTLAKGLLEKLFPDVPRIIPFKFADALYDLHNGIYDILVNKYGFTKPETKDGELLQLLGTEWGRKKFGVDVWADALKKRIAKFERSVSDAVESGGVFLVDDLRFLNEFQAFPDAYKIRLECAEGNRMARAEYWRTNTGHPSEIALDGHVDKFDLVINTDIVSKEGTLDMAVDGILKWLKGQNNKNA